MKPFVVAFAGIPGTSKSIIAQHLSCTFYLPILTNDVIRNEVKEDLLIDDIHVKDAQKLYELRRDKRLDQLLVAKKSLVLDSSVDRSWAELVAKLKKVDYAYFLINLELSEQFLINLYSKTGRNNFLPQVSGYLKQHREFMSKYADQVNLEINDNHFLGRLQLAETGLRSFIEGLSE